MSKSFADTGLHSAADTESVNLHGVRILQSGSHVHSRGKRINGSSKFHVKQKVISEMLK